MTNFNVGDKVTHKYKSYSGVGDIIFTFAENTYAIVRWSAGEDCHHRDYLIPVSYAPADEVNPYYDGNVKFSDLVPGFEFLETHCGVVGSQVHKVLEKPHQKTDGVLKGTWWVKLRNNYNFEYENIVSLHNHGIVGPTGDNTWPWNRANCAIPNTAAAVLDFQKRNTFPKDNHYNTRWY